MNNEKILQAKLDWWKSFFMLTLGGAVSLSIGYWTIDDTDAKNWIGLSSAGLFFAMVLCLMMYEIRHRQLIDEYFKNK
jgi:hypothetical protein